MDAATQSASQPGSSRLLATLEKRSRISLFLLGVGLLVLTGTVDYLTGYEMLFSVFYLVEVGLAAWFLGKASGLLMSVLSVLVWAGGDWAAGAHYSSPWIVVWNSLILMVVYFIVVWLLTRLHSVYQDLETRVQQRSRALTKEIAERQRLEAEILKVSEGEQRRIGHDLHDGLCQHLTATALAGQVLSDHLAAKRMPEATDAGKVVELVEEGISMARSVAHGLYPVEMEAEGLMAAFHELANNLSRAGKPRCVFECEAPVLIHNDATATHLYRIGQEAVRNAIRHGKPGRITIALSERNGTVTLSVEDDGQGLPDSLDESAGLGLRIMAHRASLIGGTFSVDPALTGGTVVTCSLPRSVAASKSDKPQP